MDLPLKEIIEEEDVATLNKLPQPPTSKAQFPTNQVSCLVNDPAPNQQGIHTTSKTSSRIINPYITSNPDFSI